MALVVRPNSICFFSSRRRHTRFDCDWSSDVCSSDLVGAICLEDIAAPRCFTVEERLERATDIPDRKSVVAGKRVDLGGRRIIKKKNNGNNKENHPAYAH